MAAKALQGLVESGKLKRFIDRRLVKAISHPFREHLLAVFNERITSATELSRDLGIAVPDFYKHVTALEDLGCIEEVEIERAGRKQRQGKHERFFQARATVLFDPRAWHGLPASVKADVAASQVQSICDEAVDSLRAGSFAVEDETHVSWLPGVFDRRGWDEAMVLMNEALARMMEVQKRSAERVATTGEPGIPATIAIMGFGTPSSRPLL